MSMDYSEYKRLLGADPRNRDPEFLRARDASPEFREAALEADRFETQLERALAVKPPADLIETLGRIHRLDERLNSHSFGHGGIDVAYFCRRD